MSRLLRAPRRCKGKSVPAPNKSRAESASAGRCSEPSSGFAATAQKDQEEIGTSRMTQLVGPSRQEQSSALHRRQQAENQPGYAAPAPLLGSFDKPEPEIRV